MGLGLTFVDEVVKLYRGRVEVDSVPGAGSRFTLVLPLRDPSPVVIRRPRFEPRVHASV
jgi:signal transduction histidine kinase